MQMNAHSATDEIVVAPYLTGPFSALSAVITGVVRWTLAVAKYAENWKLSRNTHASPHFLAIWLPKPLHLVWIFERILLELKAKVGL